MSPVAILFGAFFGLVLIRVPIAHSLVMSSALVIWLVDLNFDRLELGPVESGQFLDLDHIDYPKPPPPSADMVTDLLPETDPAEEPQP